MKKSVIALFSLMIAANPAQKYAQAQYHQYSSGQPQIEVDLSVLDDVTPQPQRQRTYDTRTHSTVPPVAPVTSSSLPPDVMMPPVTQQTPGMRILKPVPLAIPAEQAAPIISRPMADVPVARPVEQPVTPATAAPQEMPQIVLPLPPRAPVAAEQPRTAPVKAAVKPLEPAHLNQKETPAEKMPEPEYLPVITEDTDIPETADNALTEEERAIETVETAEPPKTKTAEPAAVPTIDELTLSFDKLSSDLDAAAQAKLDNIIVQMIGNDMRLQVRAYAQGEDGTTSSARRMSLSRALSVRSYLMDHGIKPNRVDVRAMGTETDRSPLDRVDLVFAK